MRPLFIILAIFILCSETFATTYTVTTASNAGTGSLREAITLANAAGGHNEIDFAIPGTGPFVISVSTELPYITSPLKIDGSTQPGYTVGNPQIILDGNGGFAFGLNLQADSCEINGLFVRNFVMTSGGGKEMVRVTGKHCRIINNLLNQSQEILVVSGDSSVVQGNKVGSDITGMNNVGGGGYVGFTGKGHLVGGSGAGQGNLFTYLQFYPTQSVLEGNLLGVNAVGDSSIFVTGVIEIPGTNNIITKNICANLNSGDNIVTGNKIGTDITGTKLLKGSIGRFYGGSGTVGGYLPGDGNLVAGIPYTISVGAGSQFIGNKIGTDITGKVLLDTIVGIACIGGTANLPTLVRGNTIAGASGDGISISGQSYITVTGNYIGTDSSGTIDLGGKGHGIFIQRIPFDANPFSGHPGYNSLNIIIGGTNPGDANIIVYNDSNAIEVNGGDAQFNSRYIKISRNIIKGNGSAGIELNSSHTYPPNDHKLPPVITTVNSGTGTITGTAGTGNTGDVIEVFQSNSTGKDALAFLGQATVNANGNWSLTGIPGLGQMQAVVATQTDYTGKNAPNLENTSAFSLPFLINGQPACFLELGNDTALCNGNVLILTVSDLCFASFRWSRGDTTSSINITLPGTYSVTATDTFGNPHADTIAVQFLNPVSSTISVQICSGQSYFAGGANQTTSGVYQDILTAANGCDSVITTNLTVGVAVFGNMALTLCQGDSLFAGGAWQTTTGIYYDTLSSSLGCDSILATQLTVLAHVFSNVFVTICPGDSAFAGGAWQTNPGVYDDTLTSSLGCDSTIITHLALQTPAVTNLSAPICAGDSVFAGGAWQFTTGTYYDTLTSSLGCDSLVATNVSLNTDVWPGDADNNSLVDIVDLFPIGLHYFQTGPARDSVSNQWVGQCSQDWNRTEANGSDIKHADCNGDGTIDAADTLALYLNYGLVHAKGQGSRAGTGPVFTVVPRSAVYRPGELVLLDVVVGDSLAPVSAIYGIGFTINFDNTKAQQGTVKLSFPDSWLGNIAGNLKLGKVFEQNGKADGAVVRTDHQNAGGYGTIATLQFIADTEITTLQTSIVSLSNEAVDAQGVAVPFDTHDSTFTIDGTTGIKTESVVASFGIYPNPFASSTNIEFSLKQDAEVSFKAYDLLGRVVFEIQLARMTKGMHRFQYESAMRPKGLCIAELNVNGVKTRKRLLQSE